MGVDVDATGKPDNDVSGQTKEPLQSIVRRRVKAPRRFGELVDPHPVTHYELARRKIANGGYGIESGIPRYRRGRRM